MKIRTITRWLALAGFCAALGAQAQVAAQFPQTSLTAEGSGVVEPNQLDLGLGFSSGYDDNTFQTLEQNGQVLYSLTPNVSWNMTRSRWQSDFDYSALVTESNRFDFYDRTSQSLNTTFDYQFSKALTFNVTDRFSRSVDPFEEGLGTAAISGGSPNPSFIGQPALRTFNVVDASGDYRLDAHTDINVGGSYYFQQFSDVPDASQRNSNSASGRASYRHQFTARTTAGGEYDLTKITTPFGFSTVSQRIMMTGEMALNPTMKVSVFGGPNHVSNSFVIVNGGATSVLSNASWSWSAGGTYTWTRSRVSMKASAVRQISDGGGLVGTVRLTSFQYQLNGKLPYKLSGSVHAGFNLNDTLVAQTAGFTSAKYGMAGARLTRNLRRDLTASVDYERMEQLVGEGMIMPWIDRDRITVSINYTFTHPLGR